ncbi:MAG TPA: beta-L-arabinofuranosidase domain-containing protein, partial [Methylomirabilota bacterium]|nr:beta-L-arabinofuranosidase domain-containing protein [Methylomirabilota bacterium]
MPGPVETARSPRALWRTLGPREVTISGGIWARRQAVNRQSALPHGYRMLEAAGNFENLRIAAGRTRGPYRGPVFMDSDVYKWLEAAAYEVARAPDPTLSDRMREAIELIEAAQDRDGYLDSHYQVAEPERRWTDFAHGHELYCAGHLYQAAVAHRRATGDERLMRVALRSADYIDGLFGPGKRVATPGHPEIEMALVELYRETGERRYLALAQFFVDQRGHGWLGPGRYNASAYYQDRVPVRDASELEGHAVRALYLTTGIADLYLETGEDGLLAALRRQWSDLVERKLYLTGGVGARHLAEAFGQPYELTNDLAYCETCAAIASIMWSWRMLLATGQARFADLIERTLYNAVLSGVSLDGERYFYVNPLASSGDPEHLSRGGARRRAWHLVACCPPNLMRLFASLGHYVATRDDSGVQVHQLVPARVAADLGSGRAALRIDTDYPWDGRVRVTIEEAPATSWTLALRLPGWSRSFDLRVSGVPKPGGADATGYLRICRPWSSGDTVELDVAMEARLVEAHPRIESTRGCLAIERGPLVYCIEAADHPGLALLDLEIDPAARLTAHHDEELLDGVTVVETAGFAVDVSAWSHRLYREARPAPPAARRPADLTAIPYYAWANRGAGAMRVWIPRAS